MKNNGNKELSFYNLFLMVGEMNGTLKEVKDQLKTMAVSHDTRINCLENDVASAKGQAGIVGGVVAFIVSVVSICIAYFKNNN